MDSKDASNSSNSRSSSGGSPMPKDFNNCLSSDPSTLPDGTEVTLPDGTEVTLPDGAENARQELKKLSLDQHGTFMIDFDPVTSKRELRKMNRRIHGKGPSKNNLYDERGIFIDVPVDLCDCLSKDCPGCHYPCFKCGSEKCGIDCRCNRKYFVDVIEVEGTDTLFPFPL